MPGVGLGLHFARIYNSAYSQVAERYGVFGPGWNHSYEKRRSFPYSGVIKLRNSDGTISYFVGSDVDRYQASAPYSRDSWIEKTTATIYTRRFRRGGEEVYDRLNTGSASARLTRLSDAVGNLTQLSYDTSNRLTRITDAGGRELVLGYTASQLISLSGPAGVIATFTYAGNKLGGVTYADGDLDGQPDGGFSFAYTTGSNGRLQSVTDLSGRVLETHGYDAAGRAIQTSISGDVEKFTLAYGTDTTTVTDSLGNITTYEWKKFLGSKRITKITGPCSSCGGSGASQQWRYDEHGRITQHIDGLGNTTDYTYDEEGNLETVLEPSLAAGIRHQTEYAFDANGRTIRRTAPNGAATTWTYVAAGPRTKTETFASGVTRTTTTEYFANGKVQYRRDPLNRETEFHYNALGDLDWMEDALNQRTVFEYDAMGHLKKTTPIVTGTTINTPRTTYDTVGRVVRVTNLNGTSWLTEYDGGGRRVASTDPLGRRTQYDYDPYGRLRTMTDARAGITEYRYDLMSNLRYLIDARQNATEFRYEDGHHRVTTIIYPGNLTERFSYDAAGRLLTRWDRKGYGTYFYYDTMGRLVEKRHSVAAEPLVQLRYDGNDHIGFLTRASNGVDTLTWDYDLAGQLLSESSQRNDTTVSYQYFLSGERQKLRLNGTDLLAYAYQADGQLDKITRAAGVVFDFDTDVARRRQRVTFPNGTVTD